MRPSLGLFPTTTYIRYTHQPLTVASPDLSLAKCQSNAQYIANDDKRVQNLEDKIIQRSKQYYELLEQEGPENDAVSELHTEIA
jgi:hypothetical protein